tara:strand:- start:402 stop:614 length:213 start_codon:yes stop_codon:yes gene_type:complete
MSIKKQKEIKIDDLKEQLNNIAEKYNEAIRLRDTNDELAKRCLGAMEILQSLTQEEEEEQKEDAEVRKEK